MSTVAEDRQIQQVRATLARLEAGTLAIIRGEQIVAELLARRRIPQEALDEARERAGLRLEGDR